MSDYRQTMNKNTRRLAWWTAAWLMTMAVAAFGPSLIWDFNKAWSIATIALNLAIGVGMLVANKHHLDGLDEMQRKIQLDAMALALGVTLIAGLAYSMLDISNAIESDAEISFVVMLMGLTYLAGIMVGNRRFR